MTMVVRTVAVAFAAMVLAGAAEASTLYATNYAGTTPLYKLNQHTGAATALGGSLTDIGDLTSGGGFLWGNGPLGTGSVENLVKIDPATGNAVATVPIMNAAGAPVIITSLAFDPVTHVLYGNTTDAFSGSADALYTINMATGVATQVGAIGFTNVYALGFDQTGKLFGVADATDQLIGINTSTGAGNAIATLSSFEYFDMASRPEDNVMFLLSTENADLFTVNTTTGAETLVGPWNGPGNLAGLAFLGSSNVPEPATLSLFLFGAAGLAAARRRRKLG